MILLTAVMPEVNSVPPPAARRHDVLHRPHPAVCDPKQQNYPVYTNSLSALRVTAVITAAGGGAPVRRPAVCRQHHNLYLSLSGPSSWV